MQTRTIGNASKEALKPSLHLEQPLKKRVSDAQSGREQALKQLKEAEAKSKALKVGRRVLLRASYRSKGMDLTDLSNAKNEIRET